jgi:amino acid transporter
MAGNSEPIQFYDPLSDVARKERRYLLAASIIGIALVKLQLAPSKITALGVDFDYRNQKSFFGLFALIVFYFLIAFVIYAFSDTASRQLHAYREEERRSREKDPGRSYSYYFFRMFRVRDYFDLLVPMCVAIYAIASLLMAHPPTKKASPQSVTPITQSSKTFDEPFVFKLSP